MATVGIQSRPLKSGKRSYTVWYKDPGTGKQHSYGTYRLKRVADEEVARLRTLIDTGAPAIPGRKQRVGVVNISEIATILKQEWNNRMKTGEIAKGTATNYRNQLKMIEKDFGTRMIGSISREEVINYRVELAASKSNVSSNRRLFIFKQIFARAKNEGVLQNNLIADIKYLSEKKHERQYWLKPKELLILLEVASRARSRHYMRLAILLAAEHGASKQEILGLKWNDIDFEFGEKGCITFFRDKNGVRRIHRLDMSRTRTALIERRKYLAKYRKIAIEDVDGNVIGKPDGRPLGDIKSAWNTIRQEANMGHLHFHDLRHTFCSNLIHAGLTLKQTQKLIGHLTAKMTERYSHLEEARNLDWLQRLDERYEQGGESTKAINKL